jgi:transcriptional regulator with XRE-family HTH domain
MKGSDELLYDKIKELCQKRGISVASVEKEANLSNGAIRKWNKSSPTVDSLQAVAKVLKVGMEELV